MSVALAPLERLEEAVQGLAGAVERKILGQTLDLTCSRIDELAPIQQRAESLIPVSALVAAQFEGAQRETVVDRLGEYWSLGTEAVAAVTREALDQLSRHLPRMRDLLTEIERHFQDAWKRRVEVEFAPTLALGKVLKEIPDTAIFGEMMVAAGISGIAAGRVLPLTEEKRTDFNRLLAERDAAYDLLKDSGANEETVEFLEAVSNGTATLSFVTPGVSEWLKTRGATTKFKVGLM